jgi:hypothetical protein
VASLTSRVSPQRSTQIQSAEQEDAAEQIILLDRPTDDELVQQFIRSGHTMKPHMSGVGGVFAADAPRRILLQGMKLLNSLVCWGASAPWLKVLNDPAERS